MPNTVAKSGPFPHDNLFENFTGLLEYKEPPQESDGQAAEGREAWLGPKAPLFMPSGPWSKSKTKQGVFTTVFFKSYSLLIY